MDISLIFAKENIAFFAIAGLLVLAVVFVIFIAVFGVIKTAGNAFGGDKGRHREKYAEGLRAKNNAFENSRPLSRPTLQYAPQISDKEKEPDQLSEKQKYDLAMQKTASEDLKKMAESGQAQGIGSKYGASIPVPRHEQSVPAGQAKTELSDKDIEQTINAGPRISAPSVFPNSAPAPQGAPKQETAPKNQEQQGQPAGRKPGFLSQLLGQDNKSEKPAVKQTQQGIDFFQGDNDGVDRRILRYRLKTPTGKLRDEIYQTQRNLGLSMNSGEREKLLEKYFPKHYGQELTKEEIRKQIDIVRRSPEKMGAGTQRQRTVKELKFLEKMAGLKKK